MNRTLIIRCFEHCSYKIEFPDFFLGRHETAKLNKLFKYLFQFRYNFGCQYSENEETIQFLESELPKLVDEKGNDWQKHVSAFDEEYKDPKMLVFPYGWTREEKQSEKDRVKQNNKQLAQRVREAKHEYDYAVKVQKAFLAAKEKYE